MYITKARVVRNMRKLVREREFARGRFKVYLFFLLFFTIIIYPLEYFNYQEKCASIINSKFCRFVLARRKVLNRRIAVQEFERERKLMEEIQSRLTNNEDHMLKIQRKNQAEAEIQSKYNRLRYVSAAKIQAMVRGRRSRLLFLRDLPDLRKSRQKRGFCVECELKPVRKRCLQCKDLFCDSCYEKVHKKGIIYSFICKLLLKDMLHPKNDRKTSNAYI